MPVAPVKNLLPGYRAVLVLLSLLAISAGLSPAVQADAISQERLEKQKRYLEMRERERAEKKRAKQQEEDNRATARKNCDTAKGRLHNYRTARAVYQYDKQGKKVYLSEAERANATKQAEADVKKWCQ